MIPGCWPRWSRRKLAAPLGVRKPAGVGWWASAVASMPHARGYKGSRPPSEMDALTSRPLDEGLVGCWRPGQLAGLRAVAGRPGGVRGSSDVFDWIRVSIRAKNRVWPSYPGEDVCRGVGARGGRLDSLGRRRYSPSFALVASSDAGRDSLLRGCPPQRGTAVFENSTACASTIENRSWCASLLSFERPALACARRRRDLQIAPAHVDRKPALSPLRGP
jgi:hypothetical protein